MTLLVTASFTRIHPAEQLNGIALLYQSQSQTWLCHRQSSCCHRDGKKRQTQLAELHGGTWQRRRSLFSVHKPGGTIGWIQHPAGLFLLIMLGNLRAGRLLLHTKPLALNLCCRLVLNRVHLLLLLPPRLCPTPLLTPTPALRRLPHLPPSLLLLTVSHRQRRCQEVGVRLLMVQAFRISSAPQARLSGSPLSHRKRPLRHRTCRRLDFLAAAIIHKPVLSGVALLPLCPHPHPTPCMQPRLQASPQCSPPVGAS